nr:hypothetical protein [uncultured Lichenicoccus sp.]
MRAAEIQAKATKAAATTGIRVGVLTLLGGAAAVWATLRSARLQIRQVDSQQKTVTRAIHRHLRTLAAPVGGELKWTMSQAVLNFRGRHPYDPTAHLRMTSALLDELSPSKWAVLSQTAELLSEIENLFASVNLAKARIVNFCIAVSNYPEGNEADQEQAPFITAAVDQIHRANADLKHFVTDSYDYSSAARPSRIVNAARRVRQFMKRRF